MILSNLFANAAEYADEGGRFEIAADRSPAAVTLRVANTGCRLSCGDAEHVFERFWRGDSSRSDTGIHSGLGLALVQRAVAALGGEVSASVNDGAFSVCLTFQKQGAVS
jgi:signal transduction histidine kinase